MKLGGTFYCERWRNGRLISRHRAKNGMTLVGLNDALEVLCRQQTQRTWKIGLIDAAGFDELSEDDTMASHAGWTEITAYSEGTRPAWGPGAAAGQVSINASSVAFTFTSAKTIGGLFLASDNTKGGTSGILLCTGELTTPATMAIGEQYKAIYEFVAEGR